MTTTPAKSRRAPQILLAFLLWVLAAGLGLLSVSYLQTIAFATYAFFLTLTGRQAGFGENSTGELIGQVMVVLGGVAWLAVVIGLGEYLIKHAGESKGWKLPAWIIGVELALIALGMLLG